MSKNGGTASKKNSGIAGILNVVERLGNKVPHPVLLFLMLIGVVMALSHVLHLAGASVTFQTINRTTNEVEQATTAARSLLTADGLRFIFTGMVSNFLGFVALGQLVVAMLGVGVAEESGLIKAVIRKVVKVAPRWSLCYIIVLLGIVSSIASNAGYLVLIPLAGAAFLAVGRHPIAGLAAGFAAVGGTFSVNLFVKPNDAVLVGFTNDAIALIAPGQSISMLSNLWFSIASSIVLTVLITFITERFIEPRLGEFKPPAGLERGLGEKEKKGAGPSEEATGENVGRGLKFAIVALLGFAGILALLSFPAGAALRDPATGLLIGNTPFMNSIITMIMLGFLVCGAAYGFGAGTMKGLTDVVKAMQKTVVGLSGMILLMFFIAQFVAYFNYSNIATLLAVSGSDRLAAANVGPLWLLLGFILFVSVFNLFITGSAAKWAMLAPVFVPLLMRLGVDPEAVLAGYRIGDSVPNIVTPMLSMFALILGFYQKYDPKAGIGTVFAMMLPYSVLMLLTWIGVFVGWYLLGLPWGV